jgi:hypothetical protein
MQIQKEIIIGEGDSCPYPNHTDKRNTIPVELSLCADSRKSECPFYIKIIINTKDLSFSQGFCGFKFKKEV